VRELLRDELGLEPGGELRRIEAAVLRHEVGSPAATADAEGAFERAIRPVPVRYARAADGISVAFQSAGDGPLDILAIPGYIHHLDIWWNAPTNRLVRELSGMGRFTMFDKRGMGLSDRPDTVDVEDWTLDALGVLDALGCERAVLLGVSAGAVTALRLAALYPERVSAVVLFGGYARQLAGDDYPIGYDHDLIETYAQYVEADWGTGVGLEFTAPSLANDPNVRAYLARYQRLSASPSAATRFLWACVLADVRHLLPQITVPTLVAHAERDVIVPVTQGKYIADQIAGAEFLPLDSDIHLICVSDVLDEFAGAMTAFLERVLSPQERTSSLASASSVALS
jgi:pimeloyl-ACP methyl ester carboxylesterase